MCQKGTISYWAILFSLSVSSLCALEGFQGLRKPKELPKAVPVTKEEPPVYPHRVQVGGNYTYLHLVPEGSSAFNGNLGGVQGLYEYRPMDHVYTGVRASWKQGNTTFSNEERSILYIDTHQRIGYTAAFRNETFQLSLYTGIGYHYLDQKLEVPQLSPLYFAYNEFYVPVGFAFNYVINPSFSWGLNGTYMPQVFTTVSINPLRGTYWTLTRTFKNFRIESPFDFAVTKSHRLRVLISPFFEYWQDGKSFAQTTTGIALDLPSNTYYYAGVDVNLGYNF